MYIYIYVYIYMYGIFYTWTSINYGIWFMINYDRLYLMNMSYDVTYPYQIYLYHPWNDK